MAEISIQKLTTTGVVVTYAAATVTGDHFFLEKDTGYAFRIINSGSSLTAVMAGIQLSNQGVLNSNTITVASEEKAAAIRFYSIDPDSNRVDVTYPGGVTGLTVALVEVP